jgi:hypothetical protein
MMDASCAKTEATLRISVKKTSYLSPLFRNSCVALEQANSASDQLRENKYLNRMLDAPQTVTVLLVFVHSATEN